MINNRTLKKMPFTLALLVFSLCLNKTNAQGPNAPEAASFEPVDATDMVNLSTGDFTYVLPLLNIPSPEGGYPIALSYHAGIAMDQEASWTGLGWNLNVGAVNRSVNGYPDDYNNTLLTEYFYDQGGQESIYSLSLGYSNGATSVGLGLSWGSNKSLGGHVSVGYGAKFEGGGKMGGSIKIGTDGASIGLGVTTKGGMTLGANASTNGGMRGSIGFDNNGTGFSISSTGTFGMSYARDKGGNASSIDLTLSSSGVGLKAGNTMHDITNEVTGGGGGGIQLQFENTVKMGDYTTKTSGWQIPLTVPTPAGVFSLSFGKQKFRYFLAKKEKNYVNGPIYFKEGTLNIITYKVKCKGEDYYGDPISCGSFTTSVLQEALDYVTSQEANSNVPDCQCEITQVKSDDAFMDINEIPISGNNFSNTSNKDFNNAAFPNYDKYNVQAQGLSGGMSSRLFDNGHLFGLTNKESNDDYQLKYALDGTTTALPMHAQFNAHPYFYFDNEISSYINVNTASFYNTNNNYSNILDYYIPNSAQIGPLARRNNGNFIEYFTNKEIREEYTTIKNKGYLTTEKSIDRESKPDDGIGAFKITSADGKTYHYSLPVYNHEIITRTFGMIDSSPAEADSYFEKRQLEAYATHWLLTAVTGSDYYDTNDNGYPDKGDYGFWVSFEYGKWSDAFVWKNPYGEDYFLDETNNDIKTWIRGRKEVYYLDKIKTRTHTALFIKSEREDAKSAAWNYSSVVHLDNQNQNSNAYISRFNIPSQKSLRLDKIILVKEGDDTINTSYGNTSSSSVNILYNDSNKPAELAFYHTKENLIDVDDNWGDLLNKAVKTINLNYDYSLAEGSPNTTSNTSGRLSLKSVNFLGKKGVQLIPPYTFDYINNASYSFNIADKDGFGYKSNDNSLWSLNEITTPQGGKIQINYESHKFIPVVGSKVVFRRHGTDYKITPDYDGASPSSGAQPRGYTIDSSENLGIQIGDKFDIDYIYTCTIEEQGNCGGPCGHDDYTCTYNGQGTITQVLGTNQYYLLPDSFETCDTPNGSSNPTTWNCDFSSVELTAEYTINNNPIEAGGIRVSSLVTTDGTHNYTTRYKYGENEDGIGYISYLPFAPELQEELPYSSELPSPRVMYEYINMESFGTANQSEGKIQYKFQILKNKDVNAIKFGDLYEIESVTTSVHYNATSDKDVEIKNYTIKDNLAAIGQLLEVSTFNSIGQILSKIENTYYQPDETPSLAGVTKESYQTYKEVDYSNNSASLKDKWLINSSARIKYPNLLKSSTEYSGGFVNTSEFKELDPIVGQATAIHSFSSKGLEIKSKSVPAYTINAYSGLEDLNNDNNPDGYGMGSKVDVETNKNMLTQEAMTKTYLKVSGEWKETGVGITTWNNDWSYTDYTGLSTQETAADKKIWRKHKTFVWDGALDTDGTLLNFAGEDDSFVWTLGQPQTNTEWKNISTTTKYDHYSVPLEVEDINKNYVATKMCDNHSKVLAVCNSAFTDMYYSGAEYFADTAETYFDGQVKATGHLEVPEASAHTGTHIVRLTNTTDKAFEVTLPNNALRIGIKEKFKVSVWAKKGQEHRAKIRVGTADVAFDVNETVIAGNWVMLNGYITITSTGDTVSIMSTGGGDLDLDDFRLYPVSSSMISYVYNEWDELWYIIGNNGLASKFEYDAAGRLTKTYTEVEDFNGASTESFKKTSENKYQYKNPS